MSIRIGNDYNIPKRLSTNSTNSLKSTNNTSSFANALSASMLSAVSGNTLYGGSTLYNNLNGLYSGLNYNIFDASGISQSNWARNDFPLESFFGNNIDSSILNWLPRGVEPAANSSQVLNRLNQTLGMKAIVISPELESKVNSDSRLAQDVMDKISAFIKNSDEANLGKEKSDTLILDKNGNISHYRTFVEGEGLLKPSTDLSNTKGMNRSRSIPYNIKYHSVKT